MERTIMDTLLDAIVSKIKSNPLVESIPRPVSIDSILSKIKKTDLTLSVPEFTPVPIQEVQSGTVRLVHEKYKKDDISNYHAIKRIQKGEICVVPGEHDNIENMLNLSGIPFVIYTPSRILNATTVFVNCPGNQVPYDRIRQFVKKGGFLITTDWALDSVCSKFGYIAYEGEVTRSESVPITSISASSRYLRNSFPKGITPMWDIADLSYPITIKAKKKVEVLLRSEQLGNEYDRDVVGCTFQYGDGRVFHFISHMDIQEYGKDTYSAKKNSIYFSKETLDFNDNEIESMKINPSISFETIESAYSSAMIIHNIIAARKLGYTGE
jgi:hypothetical protein